MGIKFGEIDANQIIENEFRIGVLERLLEWILNNNAMIDKPSQQAIEDMKRNVAATLSKKYPSSGIGYKGS